MKKHFIPPIFFALLLSSGTPLFAQVWSDVGGGSGMGTIFSVYSDSYDNFLYVGGNYDTLGPDSLQSRGFGYWDGTQWNDLTEGIGGFGNDITKAIGRYNGEIYHSVDIGAIFYGLQTGDHRIAKFSCTNNNCHGNTAYAFQVYQGELYAGGTFLSFDDTPDDLLNGIIKWNGVSWSKVGGGFRSIKPVDGTGVHALFVYQGKLYAGGTFDSAGSVACNNIAVWDGTAWDKVGTGVRLASNANPRVNALTIYKGQLIAGGIFDSAGSVAARNVAKWTGTTWKSVGADFDSAVKALCVYKKDLYAGGDFTFNGNDSNHIAKWDGTSWTSLGGGITGGKFVRSLTVWKKKLIVGGAFTQLEDTIVVANIASWKMGGNPGNPLKEPANPLKESVILKANDFVIIPDIISGSTVIHLTGPQTITQIEVIDQCGRCCLKQAFSNDTYNTTIELQAQNWIPGMYIMRLHTSQGIVNKKLVVM